MPAAARGLKKNLDGTLASKIDDKEHTTASLGDSEPPRIQHSPSDVQRPCVSPCRDNPSQIASSRSAKQSGDVLAHNELWTSSTRGLPHLADDPHELIEQTGACPVDEPGSLAGHAHVLARPTPDHHVHRREVGPSDLGHVAPARHVRVVPLQHRHGVLVDLNLPGDLEAGLFQPHFKPGYACEQ
jgi:hypothetical protein